MSTFGDLIGRISARIGPAAFFIIGVTLFMLKFVIDRAVATFGFGRDWSILNYLIPNETYALPALPAGERGFYLTMLAVALPFVWIGITVTLRRLRDAGLPRWLAALFFVPVANLLFFAALSIVPSAQARTSSSDSVTPPAPKPREMLDYGTDQRAATSSFFDSVMPRSDTGGFVLAIVLPAVPAAGATLLATLVLRDYGWGIFVGMPFVVGMLSAVLYGYREPRSIRQCFAASIGACIATAAVLVLFAIEGFGCLIMLMPLAVPIAMIGAALGHAIQNRPLRHDGETNTLWGVCLTLPAMIVAEARLRPAPDLFAVTTVVEIAAPPARVWPNVIEFGEITAAPDTIFRAGVAYPLRARIDGSGVGAIRYCEFSTGAFIEPIVVWEAPRLLKFSVTHNPPPMREWSPFDIHPPHLDNFLVSHGGQFKLIELPGGRTRLEGTTWYQHRMRPSAYWRWWSDFLIHRIHLRVLDHVKQLSES